MATNKFKQRQFLNQPTGEKTMRNMKKIVLLIMGTFTILLFPGIIRGDIPASERAALIILYNSTNGDNWTDNSGWKTPPLFTDGFAMPGTEKNWYGVTVNGGRVTRLDFYDNGLSGGIPSQLGNLGQLKSLRLDGNLLGGPIPSQLANLTNLEELSLRYDQLVGSIPSQLANLNQLKYLYLSHNQLTGSIPPQFENLKNLKNLYLENNQLEGGIPPQLGNLGQLVKLNLDSNQLGGNIPPELGNLSNLQVLILGFNQLEGSIPSQLGNLTQLQVLQLDGNQLRGSIPSSFINLLNISQLDVGYNCLYATHSTLRDWLDSHQADWKDYQDQCGEGTTPPVVTTNPITSFTDINAVCGGNVVSDGGVTVYARGVCWGSEINPKRNNYYKNFTTDGLGTGSFTSHIKQLEPHRQYYVRAYAINNMGISYGANVKVATTIPESERAALIALYKSTNGDRWKQNKAWKTPPLFTDGFAMQGTENEWHGVTVNGGRVTMLILYNNGLSGSIPPELAKLSALNGLYLNENYLDGPIPPELGKLIKLKVLRLSGNQLSGTIPSSLANLTNIANFTIDGNCLSAADPVLKAWLEAHQKKWAVRQDKCSKAADR
ncbi:MAG: leucine-rich repeat domain-containing protein [Acidobacteria bacterium]|nr:leucine-rich repeat domain-containing protein [Acidobacteriota bacterium]